MINFFNTTIHFFCSPGLSQQTRRICYKDESELCNNRHLTRGTLPCLIQRWKGTEEKALWTRQRTSAPGNCILTLLFNKDSVP